MYLYSKELGSGNRFIVDLNILIGTPTI